MRKRIPAGLLDAGLAALATFAIGLYAAWAWQDELHALGVYALFMAAFGLATAVGSQAVFIPAEKVTLELNARQRTTLLPKTIARGASTAIGAGLVMIVPALVASAQGTVWSDIYPLLITAGVTSVISPIQDHARRVLHLASASWSAAVTSTVQVSVAIVTIAVLHGAVDPIWVPFGALGVANVSSLGVAIVLARRTAARHEQPEPEVLAGAIEQLRYRTLLASGRWLAPTGILSTANNLVVAAIVSTLVGQEALGFAEAARTIGQPLLVLAFGLRSVLGPDSMEAARSRDRRRARRIASMFYRLTAVLGAVYLIVVGIAWVGNPFSQIVERAYAVRGLVPLAILANAFNGMAFPGRLELIGGNMERSLFTAEVLANTAQLTVAALVATIAGDSVTIGAYAVALAFATLGLTRLPLYARHLNALYRTPAPVGAA